MVNFLVADEAYMAVKLIYRAVTFYAYVVLGHTRTAKERGCAFIACFCVDFHLVVGCRLSVVGLTLTVCKAY